MMNETKFIHIGISGYVIRDDKHLGNTANKELLQNETARKKVMKTVTVLLVVVATLRPLTTRFVIEKWGLAKQ